VCQEIGKGEKSMLQPVNVVVDVLPAADAELLQDRFHMVVSAQPIGQNWVQETSFCDEEEIKPLLTRIGDILQTTAPYATASLFSKRYGRLALGTLFMMSRANIGLNVKLPQVRLWSDENGQLFFRLDDVRVSVCSPNSRIEWRKEIVRRLIEDNLRPVFETLHRHTRIPVSTLWGHIAYMLHIQYELWSTEVKFKHERDLLREDFDFIVQEAAPEWFGLTNKRTNPLHVTYEWIEHAREDGQLVRKRNQCCLAYMKKGGQCCYTCPNLKEEERRVRREKLRASATE
jgi:ferric iron reductase protein FhuF